MRVCITGGAGFIGSHLADALIESGHSVRVYDNLAPQVHGTVTSPKHVNENAELISGDVRDPAQLARAIKDVDVIFHLAAATGVGQSMYQIARYAEVNIQGTAILLDILADTHHHIEKLVLASSRAVYGEGQYLCSECGSVTPWPRTQEQLQRADWNPKCPRCGREVNPVPTSEEAQLRPGSIYAISKRVQEEMCLCVGCAYEVPVVVLRYFNVYGPRQALSNPYTGVLSIFSAVLMNGGTPEIFEDGLESRDFIYVSDAVRASVLAMESDSANFQVFNVGTGHCISILEVVGELQKQFGIRAEPHVSYNYRVGDIRHCYADTSKAKATLGFEAEITFEEGMQCFLEWAQWEEAQNLSAKATRELMTRGLFGGATHGRPTQNSQIPTVETS